MALSYGQVKDLHDALKESGAVTDDLPTWAGEMNRLTKSDLYGEGLHDNWIRRASHGLDKLLDATGIPNVLGEVGAGVGSLVGNEDAGRNIGHGALRSLVDFAPLLIPGVGEVAGLAGTGLLSGAHTYADTGSPAAGVVGGITNMLFPAAAGIGEQGVLKALGVDALSGTITSDAASGATQAISRYLPQNVGQGVAAFAGGQLAAGGLGELSAMAQAGLDPNSEYKFDPSGTLLNLTLGQVPFAGVHLVSNRKGEGFGGERTRVHEAELRQNIADTKNRLDQTAAWAELAKQNPIEKIPVLNKEITPTATAQAQARMQELLGTTVAAKTEATPQSMEEFNRQSKEYDDLWATHGETLASKPLELPITNPDEKPVFSALDKTLQDATNDVDTAKTLVEFHQAAGKLNYVRVQNGMPPLSPERLQTIAENRGLSQARALKAEINKTAARQKALQETTDLGQLTPGSLQYINKFGDQKSQLDVIQGIVTGTKPFAYEPMMKEAATKLGLAVDDKGFIAKTPELLKNYTDKVKQLKEDYQQGKLSYKQYQGEAGKLFGFTKAEIQDFIKVNPDLTRRKFASDAERVAAEESDNLAKAKARQGIFETPLPRLDHDTEALHDILSDTIAQEQVGKDSQESFRLWQKQNPVLKDTTSLPIEQERYKIYWRLRESEDIGRDAKLSLSDLETFNGELKKEGLGVPTPGVLADFPERDHVLNWDDAVEERLKNRNAPIAPESKVEPKDGEEPLTLSAPLVPRYTPQSPEQATKIAQLGLDKGASGLLDYVRSTADNPAHVALADALAQFPEQLKRSAVVILPDDQGSSAWMSRTRRNGNIGIQGSLLDTPPSTFNTIALHEMVHQVTQAQIDAPTTEGTRQAVTSLDALRNRVREALPADVRAGLANAEKSNWMERWQKSDAPGELFDELSPDHDKANLIYAMLNTKEFVAQGMENGATRKFLQSQPGQKLGAWGKFTRYVKGLLGIGEKVSDNAFGEFLGHVGALTDTGEHVASFFNFGERYLQNQGLSTGMASVQTQRAMRLLHEASVDGATGESLLSSLDSDTLNRGPQFQRATNNLDRSITNADEDYASWVSLAPEMGQEPTRAGLDAFAQDALRGDTTALQALDVLPETQARYMFEKLHNMREVLDTVRAATVKKNDGLLNLTNPSTLRKPVASALKSIDAVLDSEKMLDQAVTMIQGLSGMTPAGYFQNLSAAAPTWMQGAQAPKAAENLLSGGEPESPGLMKRVGKKLEWFFKPATQYTDPYFTEGNTKLLQLQANARAMSDAAFRPLAVNFDDGGLPKKLVDRFKEFLGVNKLSKALNKWIYENQKAGGDKVTKLDITDSRVAQHMKGFTDKEKSDINDMMDRHGFSQQFLQRQILEKQKNIMLVEGAKILNRNTDLKHSQSLVLTNSLWDAFSADFNDPVASQKAQADIAAVQQRLDPAVFTQVWDFLKNQKDQYDTQKSFFDANPNWASAQRTGPYRVKFFNKAGKVEVQGAENEKDAKKIVEDAGGKLVELKRVSRPGDEYVPHISSDIQGITDRLSQLLEQELNIRRSAGESADDLEQSRRISSVNQFLRETAARGVDVEQAPVRGLTRGAENVPYLANHLSYMSQQSNYWTRRLARSEVEAVIAQREVPPEVKENLKTHLENVMQADPENIKSLNNLTRTWFMGYNVASALVNSVQSFVTHVAELTNLTGKPLDSYRRVLSSLRELGGRFLPKWTGATKEWGNPELAQLEKDAQKAGELGLSQFDSDALLNEATAMKFKQAVSGARPQTLGQYASSLFSGFSRGGMLMFQHAESMNNRLAINTAFKLFREQGMPYEQARDAAFDFNHKVNFGGGRAARPLGAYSGRSPVLRGAAMLGTSMQSYVLGTTFQIIRYLKNGLFRPQGLTPHEVFSARKAGIQMLATQLAAAGVLGLPFVSGAISLLDKAFPEAEVNRHLREGVQGFYNEDAENGGPLTDISMTGLPSMLGWDLQSRLSMGNTLPGVSEVNGFQPENLLGPPANLIANFVRGGTKLAQGQVEGAAAFVPSALKKLTDLVSSGGDLRDYRDRPIATDVTPGEKVGMVLGFNPKRLSDFNAAARMADLSDTNEKRATGEFNQQMAEEVMKGNFGSVKQTLLQKAQADKGYSPVDAVHAIARVAEELSFPRDLRREGISNERSRLLSAFNLDSRQPPETLRLQFRNQIEQRLGLMVPPSMKDQAMAQAVDALRATHPLATRSELRRLAEITLRRQNPQVLAE